MKNYLFFLLLPSSVFGQNMYDYEQSFTEIKVMFTTSYNFKKAVFLVEKSFDNTISEFEYNEKIDLLKDIVAVRFKDNLIYTMSDSLMIKKYAAIYKSITDTTKIQMSSQIFEFYPFRYDFEDIFGEKSWKNMFVTKLLATRKGNCHSLPYLYKILCEELGVPCYLALAPNHIYIKHRSEKAGMYNTELTSASFPIDAWLMASGYITLEAIQNGIYMDALDDKKCIALWGAIQNYATHFFNMLVIISNFSLR